MAKQKPRPFRVVSELYQSEGTMVFAEASRPCFLLDEENRCIFHSTRPEQCADLRAGDDVCQQARQAAGLEPLEPVTTSKYVNGSEDRSPNYIKERTLAEELYEKVAERRRAVKSFEQWRRRKDDFPESR